MLKYSLIPFILCVVLASTNASEKPIPKVKFSFGSISEGPSGPVLHYVQGRREEFVETVKVSSREQVSVLVDGKVRKAWTRPTYSKRVRLDDIPGRWIERPTPREVKPDISFGLKVSIKIW